MSTQATPADSVLATLLGSELFVTMRAVAPDEQQPPRTKSVSSVSRAPLLASPAPMGQGGGGGACRVALSDALPGIGSAQYVAVCFSSGPKCVSCREFYPKLGELLRSGALEAASLAPVLALAGRNYHDVPDEQYDEDAAGEAAHFQLPALPRSAASRALLPLLAQTFGVTTNPHVLVLDRASGRVLAGGRDMRPELVTMHRAQQRQGKAGLEPTLDAWRAALVASGPADLLARAPAATLAQPTVRLRLGLDGSKPRLLASVHRVHPSNERLYVDEEAVRIRAGLLHLTTWIMFLQLNFRVFGESFKIIYYTYPLVAWDMLGGAFIGLTPFTPYGVLASLIAHALRRPLNWKPQAPKRFAWMIGFTMATVCFVASLAGQHGWDTQVTGTVIRVVLTVCQTATWLEACAGWCLGCSVWNYIVVPFVSKYMGSQSVEECQECKV